LQNRAKTDDMNLFIDLLYNINITFALVLFGTKRYCAHSSCDNACYINMRQKLLQGGYLAGINYIA